MVYALNIIPRLSFSLLLAISYIATGATPNGLCILKGKDGGFGKGFIVDEYLFSAAHVFAQANGSCFCAQDSQIIDITSRKSGEVVTHPIYLDPMSHIKNLRQNLKGENEAFVNGTLKHLTMPFDLAFIRLSGAKLKSDFILDPFDNVASSAQFQNPLGKPKTFKLQEDGSVSIEKNEYDVSASVIEYQPDLKKLSLHGGELELMNLYLDYDMNLKPGDSGSPVVLPLDGANQKYFVIGVVAGTYGQIHADPFVPHSDRVPPTVIASATILSAWLKSTLPACFLQIKACENLAKKLGN